MSMISFVSIVVIQQTLSNSNDNIASHTYSNTKPEIENETADHIRLTEEAKHLFNNTTKSIGRLAGMMKV